MTDPEEHPAAAAPGGDHGSDHAGDHHADHDFTGPLSPGVARFIRAFVAVAVVLAAVDFFIDRSHHHVEGEPHSHISVDTLPTFYAVYGFVGCVILVLVAMELRKVLMRDEDYYDPSGEEAKR